MKITQKQYQWEIDQRVKAHAKPKGSSAVVYRVTFEDGFELSTEDYDLDTYRSVVRGIYDWTTISHVYAGLYQGLEDYDASLVLSEDNWLRFSEQDFLDSPDAWAFIVDTHIVSDWTRVI